MIEQKKYSGALMGATGAVIEATNFKTAYYRRRAEWANALAFCLGECDTEDATAICAAFLDAHRTSGPALALFNDTRGEAEFWADCAHVAEVEAVTLAGLRRLGQMALGINTRKRIFAALWDSFADEDRMSFARRVGMIGGAA